MISVCIRGICLQWRPLQKSPISWCNFLSFFLRAPFYYSSSWDAIKHKNKASLEAEIPFNYYSASPPTRELPPTQWKSIELAQARYELSSSSLPAGRRLDFKLEAANEDTRDSMVTGNNMLYYPSYLSVASFWSRGHLARHLRHPDSCPELALHVCSLAYLFVAG